MGRYSVSCADAQSVCVDGFGLGDYWFYGIWRGQQSGHPADDRVEQGFVLRYHHWRIGIGMGRVGCYRPSVADHGNIAVRAILSAEWRHDVVYFPGLYG